MKEVVIIPVNLSFDLEEAITNHATSISEVTQQKVTDSIANLQAIQELKNKKKKVKDEQENAITTALDEVENAILTAGENGMPISSIMDKINNLVPTTSGFVQRMQKHLINKGAKYRLDKHKRYGVIYYRLLEFNESN